MAKVELKQPIVDEITANVKDADAVVLVNYLGITVAGDTALRKELREAGITYKVYKNTMMNFAFKGTEFEALCPHLHGANAIAICKDDATAPARIIKKHLKANPTIHMVGGVIEASIMMRLRSRHWRMSRAGKCCLADCLVLCRVRLRTSRE